MVILHVFCNDERASHFNSPKVRRLQYPLTAQTNMLHEIKKTLTILAIVAVNKYDLADFPGEWEYRSRQRSGAVWMM